jgi:hypothetical protein
MRLNALEMRLRFAQHQLIEFLHQLDAELHDLLEVLDFLGYLPRWGKCPSISITLSERFRRHLLVLYVHAPTAEHEGGLTLE